jgi:ATP-dependent Clp protease adaptor protein ClpS
MPDYSPDQNAIVDQMTAARPVMKKLPKYRVVMLNDDYTPMDFVVGILAEVFSHDPRTAHSIMLDIHVKGQGTCGVYSREIGESKMERVKIIANEVGHPLLCLLEPDK